MDAKLRRRPAAQFVIMCTVIGAVPQQPPHQKRAAALLCQVVCLCRRGALAAGSSGPSLNHSHPTKPTHATERPTSIHHWQLRDLVSPSDNEYGEKLGGSWAASS